MRQNRLNGYRKTMHLQLSVVSLVPENLIKVPETGCQNVKISLSCVATPVSRRRI